MLDRRLLSFLFVCGLLSCGGAQGGPDAAQEAAAASKEPTSVGEQLSWGSDLYAAHCATCHGKGGKGGDSPPLVGPEALPASPAKGAGLRTASFETAADLISFVQKEMPPGEGGSLTEPQYHAVVAYLLDQNGVGLEQLLSRNNAPRISLN